MRDHQHDQQQQHDRPGDDGFQVMSVNRARRALTAGDLRSDIAFQQDVNRLLASVDELGDALDEALDGDGAAEPARDGCSLGGRA